MELIKSYRPYWLSGVVTFLVAIPVYVIFSDFAPVKNSLGCLGERIVPECTLKIISVEGDEMLGGALVDLEMPAIDNCTVDLEVEYILLEEGIRIESPYFLSCGTHRIQSLVTDRAANVSVCEFDILVYCNPINLDKMTLHSASAELMAANDPHTNWKEKLGSLSVIWESGHQGPGVISNGKGDPGGPSYGLYQISLNKGYLKEFLENEGSAFHSMLGHLTPGSESFNEVWREIGDTYPQKFRETQHEYIYKSHYVKYVNRVRRQLGLDVDRYSKVLKDVLWSTAVQHGPFSDVFYNALKDHDLSSLSEEDIIKNVYEERGRMENGDLIYFPRVGPHWKTNLLQRFRIEQKMALSRLPVTTSDFPPVASTDSSDLQAFGLPDEIMQNEDLIAQVSVKESDLRNPVNVKAYKRSKPRKPAQASSTPQKTEPPKPNPPETARLETAESFEGIPDNPEGQTNGPNVLSGDSSEERAKSNLKTYRILFVVLKDKGIRFSKLDGLGQIFEDPVKANQIRYLIGQTTSLERAKALQKEVMLKGYKRAMITQYKGDRLVDFID